MIYAVDHHRRRTFGTKVGLAGFGMVTAFVGVRRMEEDALFESSASEESQLSLNDSLRHVHDVVVKSDDGRERRQNNEILRF